MAWERDRPTAEFFAVPSHLVAVFTFLNTRDERMFGEHEPDDELADPAALAGWLAVPACTPADHRLALQLRRVLRAAARANRTGEPDPAMDEIEELSAALPLRAHADGVGLGLAPAGRGVGAALADLLATVVVASADGSWRRVKACGAPDCGWIFYDHSKPRNGRWCSTAGCGNRMKTRAYRHRKHSI